MYLLCFTVCWGVDKSCNSLPVQTKHQGKTGQTGGCCYNVVHWLHTPVWHACSCSVVKGPDCQSTGTGFESSPSCCDTWAISFNQLCLNSLTHWVLFMSREVHRTSTRDSHCMSVCSLLGDWVPCPCIHAGFHLFSIVLLHISLGQLSIDLPLDSHSGHVWESADKFGSRYFNKCYESFPRRHYAHSAGKAITVKSKITFFIFLFYFV